MKLFSLPNLSSSKPERLEISPGDIPGDLSLPAFPNKTAYRLWCAKETTDHAFISCVEGLQPGLRVSSANEPCFIHGLIGEFDAAQPEGWEEKLGDAEHPPTWVLDSFTPGHVRMIWAFAHPVGWINARFGKEFYRLAWQGIRPTHCGVGWKEDESTKASQYFEIGRNWRAVGGAIPATIVEGWVAKACTKVNWNKEAVAVPFDRLQAEGERAFPGRWPGGWENFVVGARGPRFWDASADAESVIVYETGCVCFTGDRPFMPWRDIFGPRFVQETGSETIGKAIEAIWWEPRDSRYWERVENGKKIPLRKDDLIMRLERAGLTRETPKGETFSQVEEAIFAIQRTKQVDGVAPCLYREEDVVVTDGLSILNNSTVRLVLPAPEPGEWGKGFPLIAEYWSLAFRDQLPWYTSWLAHYYRSCLRGHPARGQAAFLAGKPDSGKSFNSFAILRQLFGGQQDASAFLQGVDRFNDTLAASPIWTLDDAVASTDGHARDRFTQIVKQFVANDRLPVRGMHRSSVTVTWLGRIVVTLNADDESIRMIPNMDLSIADKVSLFIVHSVKSEFSYCKSNDGRFPTDEEIQAELPWLAAWLRDMVIPSAIATGGRWGVAAWHHPELVAAADDASDQMATDEVLDDWRREWFADRDKETAEFTLTELHRLIATDDTRRAQIRTVKALGSIIGGMQRRGVGWIRRKTVNGWRLIEVKPPEVHIMPLKKASCTHLP